MKVRIKQHVSSYRTLRDLKPGTVIDVPAEWADQLVSIGLAEKAWTGPVEEKPTKKPKPEIYPELAGWLSSRGFVLNPEGVAYVRTDRLETGDVVKLVIDFTDTSKGARFGYRLDLTKDPPEWKPDKALRDHPVLLGFKHFRDEWLERGKPKPVPEAMKELPAAEGQALLQKVEAKDEEQILAEMRGDFESEILKQLFYSFEQAGRRVVGLSYKGVKQMAIRQGHIEVKELELKESEKAWVAVCKARDKARDLEVYGASIQLKEMVLRDGSKVLDPFAMTKVVSKAQRNAMRGLISEVLVMEAYKRWLEEHS